jgi:hypothetical protein
MSARDRPARTERSSCGSLLKSSACAEARAVRDRKKRSPGPCGARASVQTECEDAPLGAFLSRVDLTLVPIEPQPKGLRARRKGHRRLGTGMGWGGGARPRRLHRRGARERSHNPRGPVRGDGVAQCHDEVFRRVVMVRSGLECSGRQTVMSRPEHHSGAL